MTKVVNFSSLDRRICKEKRVTPALKKFIPAIRLSIHKLNFERKRLYCKFNDYMYYYSDKITREGLFGEDKGKGYCGTDVDFIPEEAYDYRLIKRKASKV